MTVYPLCKQDSLDLTHLMAEVLQLEWTLYFLYLLLLLENLIPNTNLNALLVYNFREKMMSSLKEFSATLTRRQKDSKDYITICILH